MSDDFTSAGSAQPASGMNAALARNIRVLRARQAQARRDAPFQDRLADAVRRAAGSMAFVYIHLLLVAGWVGTNLGLLPGAPAFDPTFVGLATVASVEAIFLTAFVLISQNRADAASDRRDELDLQINLLAEHEVTRLISMVVAIARKLDIEISDPESAELQRDVAPEAVLDTLESEPR